MWSIYLEDNVVLMYIVQVELGEKIDDIYDIFLLSLAT